jgi:hypothetical protein
MSASKSACVTGTSLNRDGAVASVSAGVRHAVFRLWQGEDAFDVEIVDYH